MHEWCADVRQIRCRGAKGRDFCSMFICHHQCFLQGGQGVIWSNDPSEKEWGIIANIHAELKYFHWTTLEKSHCLYCTNLVVVNRRFMTIYLYGEYKYRKRHDDLISIIQMRFDLHGFFLLTVATFCAWLITSAISH